MGINKRTFFIVFLTGTAFLVLFLIARFNGPGPYELEVTPPTEVREAYDLVVVGSDPEGIAAAVSGARNGLSVLLVDTRPELGGLLTRGWLNSLDMNYGPDGEILNKGIFLEFFNRIKGDSFDVREARWVLNRLAGEEENLDVVLDVQGITPVLHGEAGNLSVGGIEFSTGETGLAVSSKAVIDATQDGDMAALAGVPFSVGQKDIGRNSSMAVTRVFKLTGVGLFDWLRIIYALRYDGNKSTGANWRSAWGFGDITSLYEPADHRVALRGLNIGRQRDGSLLVNALLVLGVDPLATGEKTFCGEMSPAGGISRRQAGEIAEAELPLVVEFLRANVPGMGSVELGGVAPELYVRESRHIYAEYRLTLDDVLENRDFADRVAFGSYPVDIQPSGPGIPGVVIGTPLQYAVPFRCLVPLDMDGLLVVGRAAGFDSLAHGSARTIPVGMAIGQAAGAAAALALEKGLSFRALAADASLMALLQSRLNEQGMELQPFEMANELAGHPAYRGLKFVRGLGLAAGGYNNDYRLDEPIEHQRFLNVLSGAVKQCGTELGQPDIYAEPNVFNVYDACYALTGYLGLEKGKEESLTYLLEEGFFKDRDYWEKYFNRETSLSHGAAYMLIEEFIGYAKAGHVVS